MTEDEYAQQMLNYMREHPGETSYTFTYPDADEDQAGPITAALRVMREIVGPLVFIKLGEEGE